MDEESIQLPSGEMISSVDGGLMAAASKGKEPATGT